MGELKAANAALGDRDALDRIWREHGYWFFRDVLDKEALGEMRSEYLAELRALDLLQSDVDQPLWNGKPLDAFPAKFSSLHERRVWQKFVKSPKINRFFEDVLGDTVYWIPMDYYRLVPPTTDPGADPYAARHQDGFSNPGIDFVTCWIPLADTDADVGGLAIAEGEHKRGVAENVSMVEIGTPGGIPKESWSRADYRLGDVLIFTPSMPHSGLPNTSDRFRLSLDIRAVRRSSRLPVVGEVQSISTEQVVIRDEEAGDVRLRLDEATHLRGLVATSIHPMPIELADVARALPPGSLVMATRDGDRALMMRPHN